MDMYLTCQQIEQNLLSGKTVGECQLSTPAQFRLLDFFLNSDERTTGNFSTEYIEALKKAYLSEHEIIVDVQEEALIREVEQWHIHKLIASNFGGLNAHKGATFEFLFDQSSYIFEGYNGQGKTSLTSAVIWAFTGKALNADKEPDSSSNFPQAVKDLHPEPYNLPDWPPVCSYPNDRDTWLNSSPNTKVSIELISDKGNQLTLERELLASGETKLTTNTPLEQVGITDLLLDTCLVMPNKIPHIKLSENQDIVEAIVKMIGLQPLVDLADHVDALCHGNKNFSRDPKESEVQREKQRIDNGVSKVKEILDGLGEDLSALNLQDVKNNEVSQYLADLQTVYGSKSSECLSHIKEHINNTINIDDRSHFKKLNQSITTLNNLCKQDDTFKDIAAVSVLDILISKEKRPIIENLVSLASKALSTLKEADYVRLKQQEDQKLKLKAAAAEFHTELHGDAGVADCPLCERDLNSKELQDLSRDIYELKAQAALTKKEFSDTCAELYGDLIAQAESIGGTKSIPNVGNVKAWLCKGMIGELNDNDDLMYVLPSAVALNTEEIKSLFERIADDQKYTTHEVLSESFPEHANNLIRLCERVFSLFDAQAWWAENREDTQGIWESVFNVNQENPEQQSFGNVIKIVSEAVDKAKPYEDAAELLLQASQDAEHWFELAEERRIRQEIREAIAPLKELRQYVVNQATATLESLSDNAASIFQRIYIPTKLGFSKAVFGKNKTIGLKGVVNNVAEIDAPLIANSSWLQATLWAFWLALRQNVIEQIGYNPLPVITMDDPQATFDFHHVREWAKEFGAMTKTDCADHPYAQMVIASYDSGFVNDLEYYGGFNGRTAYLERTDEITIVDGNIVERAWYTCERTQQPAEALAYIKTVREHYEAILKILLRGYRAEVEDDNLSTLAQSILHLGRKQIAPFNIPSLSNLANDLSQNGTPAITTLNQAHHSGNERLSFHDASTVKTFYDLKRDKVSKAFNLFRQHMAFVIRQDNNEMMELDNSQKEKVAEALPEADAIVESNNDTG